jgi:hypothetical protein
MVHAGPLGKRWPYLGDALRQPATAATYLFEDGPRVWYGRSRTVNRAVVSNLISERTHDPVGGSFAINSATGCKRFWPPAYVAFMSRGAADSQRQPLKTNGNRCDIARHKSVPNGSPIFSLTL